MSGRGTVGMYATVGPRCGIADYTRALTHGLAAYEDVTTVPLRPGGINPVRHYLAGRRLSQADVVHVQHTYGFFGVDQLTYTLSVRLLCAGIRKPLVVTAHTVREPGPARFDGGVGSLLANAVEAPAWLDVRTFARADAVIVHAELHKERLVGRGIAADRIHVIPPAVPPFETVPAESVRAFRRRLGVSERAPVVGVLGFLDMSKQYLDVLDAVAGLPDAPVVLLAGGTRRQGDDAVEAAIRSAAERLQLAARVCITGYLEPSDVPPALEAMDVVVVPYATEDSVSYSLHRALGQARPIVATNARPIREVQDRAGCLALVPMHDAGSLRDTLARLLSDAGFRARLAEGARAYGRRETPDVAANRTHQVYCAVRKAVA